VASLSSIDRQVPFSFEHAWEMTAADYVRLNAVPRLTTRVLLRLAAIAVLGVAALFWRYTAGVGVVVLLVTGFVAALPRLGGSISRRRFAESAYLRGPVAYGVSSRGFWLCGQNFGAEADWAGLGVWQEREGWLVLSASGIPPVYLPIGDLRSAGVFDAVKTLAQAHAREFGAPEADARPRGPVADSRG
jgi:hypothetical protein